MGTRMVAIMKVTTLDTSTLLKGAMKTILTDDSQALILRVPPTFHMDKNMTDALLKKAHRTKCLGAFTLERHRQTSRQQLLQTKRSAIFRRR